MLSHSLTVTPLLSICAMLVVAGRVAVDTPPPPPVTFNRDIAPILFEHCSTCHRPGEIGPFSLLSYRDARPRAVAIARATRRGTMPPWKPDPQPESEFAGARRLTATQIAILERWVSDGAPEGHLADLPPFPQFPDGWRLGEPDLVIQLSEAYRLPASGQDLLRNFIIPIPVTGVRYVKGLEFRPGNNRVVHHSNLRIDPSRESRRLDEADPEPGYDGRLVAATAGYPDGHFLGWTPGQLPPLLSDGMAWRLDAGSDLVVQLHLRPTGEPEEIRPSVGFFFTERPPARTPVMLRLGRHDIDIPAGSRRHVIEDSYTLPVDVDVHAIQPHAHFRAKDILGVATLLDGSEKPLIHIADWDFNWQDSYRYRTPVAVPKGSTLRMRFTYDNSTGNRRNPDRPARRVRWGEDSANEMGDLWIQVVPRTEADRRLLMADFAPKVIADDAAGYEKLLEVDPGNARLHDAIAVLYLTLGKGDAAIAHLKEALRLSPRSAETHYNLATALARQQRVGESVDHFRQTLRIEPDHVAAHVNLGAALRSQLDFGEAAIHLRRALQLAPRNAAAHTNLGGVLLAERKPREAIAHYRLALDAKPDLLEALTDLAWVLATSSDQTLREPTDAVRLAERAAGLTNRQSVRALDTLGAAYAASGDFARAIATTRAAVAIAEAAGHADSASALRARIALYRKRTPFLQP